MAAPALPHVTSTAARATLLGIVRIIITLLLFGRGGGRLLGVARDLEDVVQAVVALMAGVLVELAFAGPHVKLDRPRLCPRRWIVEGHPVIDVVFPYAREALDQMKGCARSAVVDLVAEVRRVDNESVAVHAAA